MAAMQGELEQGRSELWAARDAYDSRLREATNAAKADIAAERERSDKHQAEACAALLANTDLKADKKQPIDTDSKKQ